MFNFFLKSIPEVDASEVKKALDEKKDCILLDVRTPMEYEKTHIKTGINLSVENFSNKDKIENLIPDKDKTIYVYCLSGSRSSQAVQAMIEYGYTNVINMKSGLLAWRAKGYPLL
ncbi:MAG TPA: rhodanese-like domain-containing protein [Candidatus Acidoferrales bacterium]|nr:rhodanese-like domain-containing protein [Candidatus Acidoferrales bacterium]